MNDKYDPYLYPGTDVLKNLKGIQDEAKWRNYEAVRSSHRNVQLEKTPIRGNFDLNHLKAIHKHLFQDVYEWAGKLRSVTIGKGGSRFGPPQHMESYLNTEVFQKLSVDRKQWRSAGVPENFPDKLAHYLGGINAAHPFREGNGRTQRIFIGQLARENGYEIQWEKIEQKEMIAASIASFNGKDEQLASLIRANIQPMPTQKIPGHDHDF